MENRCRGHIPMVFIGCAIGGLVIQGPVRAQLPPLRVNPSGNRTVVVSWPYTNSGFTFQETTNLRSVTWQANPQSPTFDSNTSTFSLSAPATNAFGLFRLKQPADLRGIYVDSNAFPLGTNNSAALAASLTVPGVDGLVLVLSWTNLESSMGSFNWKDLNTWMSNAMQAKLRVDLSIRAGNKTPSWLFDPSTNGGAGAKPLTFSYSAKDGQLGNGNCDTETIAAPWDTNFLTAWNDMLAHVSSHLKAIGTYDTVKLLRLTGINRDTDELHLPAQTTNSTGLDCVSDAPAIWSAAGYSPSNLLWGWSNILSSFQTYFPDKSFSVAIIAPTNVYPFPPIDDNHNITNVPPDQNFPLLSLAAQMFRGRLVIQNNSLYPGERARPQTVESAVSLGTLIGFQTNENGPGESATCGTANNPTNCADASYLVMLNKGIYPLDATNSLRAQYIEVFAADVNAFSNAVWQAHLELFASP
jgi:hypothetical protein